MNNADRVPSLRVHQTPNTGVQGVANKMQELHTAPQDKTGVEDWKRARRVRSQHAWFMREFALPSRRGELG